MPSGKIIQWQLPMQRVLLALIPIVTASVYFYGWRALLLLAVVNVAGFLTEYAFTRTWNQPVTSAVFVSSTLFGLSLPPALPLWMAVVGVVFGILFGKMVFGGFGKNIFNPALSGRAFIYASFGGPMTTAWTEPAAGPWGGLLVYTPGVDAVTQATPGMTMKAGEIVGMTELLLGNTAGVIGGTSAILTILCGGYLVWKKTASYQIVVSGLLGFLGMHSILWMAGMGKAVAPLSALFAGSAVIGIFFYATDPVSAPKQKVVKWWYGGFIGVMSSLITSFSAWPAGTMFAILLANMFAPLADHAAVALKKRRQGAGS